MYLIYLYIPGVLRPEGGSTRLQNRAQGGGTLTRRDLTWRDAW